MAKHRTRVGLHARNDVRFTEPDYVLVREARIETLKMMSFTDPGVFDRLRRENASTSGGIEFIVRLYDDRLRRDSRPSPAGFVAKMTPMINRLKPYTAKFEIHNEPNHAAGIEGWGPSDEQAANFAGWYREVLMGLEQAGFHNLGWPGLAVGEWGHRERSWAIANKQNIKASDWIGVHCYWQTAEQVEHPDLGYNWRWYRRTFPKQKLIVTEAGNSGCDGPMGAPSPQEQADQYARWCELAAGEVHGVAFFILGGTEHWRGFQVHPETIRRLEGI